jgi:hypothetical protein
VLPFLCDEAFLSQPSFQRAVRCLPMWVRSALNEELEIRV